MTTLRLTFLVLAALVFAQLNEWRPLDQALAGGVAITTLAYFWSRMSLRGVAVSRRIPSDRTQVGQVFVDEITVRNRSILGKLWVEIRDRSTLPGHNASRVINLGSRKSVAWQIATLCAKRGRFQIGPISLSAGDPLGLFPTRTRMRANDGIELLVYPAVVELDGFELPTSSLTGGAASERRTQIATPMVASIRDYVQGDAFNRISWTATARHGRLMVKEFDVDPTADVWLVLDLEASQHARAAFTVQGNGDKPAPVEAWLDGTDEYAVTVVASLARNCLDRGRAVGMIASGTHYEVIQAERSDRTYIKILETLAVVIPDGHRPLSEVLVAESQRFARNSALIVVTPSTDPSWVEALRLIRERRVQSGAVVLDRASFRGEPTPDHVWEPIAASRIKLYPVRYGDRIADALRLSLA